MIIDYSKAEKQEIYETVPIEFKDLEEEKHRLLEYLRDNKGRFFKSKELASKTGFPISNTCVELRKAVTELIEEEKYPIITSSSGFAWASHPNQISYYIESLEARIKGINRRINSLNEIKDKMQQGKQITIPFYDPNKPRKEIVITSRDID